MDEREAIARLKRGEIGGLETLVRKYQAQAVRAAYLVTDDRYLAEDIVQAAFLRAYERIGQFDSSKPFGPWFLRSVVNDALKAVAKRGRQVSLDGESGGEEPAMVELLPFLQMSLDELIERAEAREAVRNALDRLSLARRAAIVLKYYLELTEPEIADRLNWPLGTVKRRLHDARKHLRSLLEATFPERVARNGATQVTSADLDPDAAFPIDGKRK